MQDTLPHLRPSDFPAIDHGHLDTLQVNMGYLCNQSCLHCHVNAGPNRKELMTGKSVRLVLDYLQAKSPSTLDLTGGAPEMNPHFRTLVHEARAMGVRVIDRCNLTILEEPGYDDLADFLAEEGVEVAASLPCYLGKNVDAQRGSGVFARSVSALQRLNRLGYGREDSALVLNLVYNPQGAVLPPPQQQLEAAYKHELKQRFGILFNQLFTITNMPIQRFGSTLLSHGHFDHYMQLLKSSYSEENLAGVMCRHTVSVDWQGYIYDCDFNQMLGLPAHLHGNKRPHLADLMQQSIEGEKIVVMDHCYGCTAGQGSSCGGALETA